jgi:hypothetical protein
MAYALGFSETAAEDLARLFDSVTRSRHAQAINAIDEICRAFAARENLETTGTLAVHFTVDEVNYYWGAAYSLSADRRTVNILHVWRAPPL